MTLVELYEKGGYDTYPTDKVIDHSYLPEYDKLFAPFQYKKINIFEIGYYKGGSTKLWEDYFPYAQIRVIDVNPQWCNGTKMHFSDRVKFMKKDVKSLNVKYFEDFIPDIVIDDGLHLLTMQVGIIRLMYPIINEGGMIIVEDFNVEKNEVRLANFEMPHQVIDLRSVKGREDDAFILVRK